MKHSISRALLGSVFLLGLILSSSAQAQNKEADPAAWKTNGAWAHLYPLLGTDDLDKVLDDSKVKAELKALLGDTKLNLKEQFAVHGTIGLAEDCLVFTGNMVGKADTNQAYMEACIKAGEATLIVYDGTFTVYTKRSAFQYLSNNAMEWIFLQNGDNFEKIVTQPGNVTLKVAK